MSTRQVIALGGAALGALAALNSALTPPSRPPEAQTLGEARQFTWQEGTIHYGVAGSGPALLLVHGIGVTASSFEMRYVAEPLARAFRVYTIDLLGFGLSERPRVEYSTELYVRLLRDFMREVLGPGAAVIACGLSASYAIEVAAQEPELVRAAVLSSPISPAGESDAPAPFRRTADTLLSVPILGQSLFNAMTARNGIRSFLRERAYSNPDLVTESMVDAQYAMAHQPNARLAAQAFLAGRLNVDVRQALTTLRQPILAVFGADAVPSPRPIASAFVRLNPSTQILMLERSGTLPHEEQAERFAAAATASLSV